MLASTSALLLISTCPLQVVGSQPWPIGRAGSCELMLGCMAKAKSYEIFVNPAEVRGCCLVVARRNAVMPCRPSFAGWSIHQRWMVAQDTPRLHLAKLVHSWWRCRMTADLALNA